MQDAGVLPPRGATVARCNSNRRVDADQPAELCADRAEGLLIRADRRRAADTGGKRCIRDRRLGEPTRKKGKK